MIDKFEYYHGAALVRVVDDPRCYSIKKRGQQGYLVNDAIFVFLKYSTKSRSPWEFSFDAEDVLHNNLMQEEYGEAFLGLICGGDGICGLGWSEAKELLGGQAGRIAAGRKHNRSYSVWGTTGEWKRKISLRRWPALLFEPVTGIEMLGEEYATSN
ncbi:MAG: hypothetical protein KIT46_01135 [Anaerolineales bacterium]|nr:hypothetical protein [Anaerolineales bacterium]MCW5854627.1 hypothetical protein [Anaerolineales bacterium]